MCSNSIILFFIDQDCLISSFYSTACRSSLISLQYVMFYSRYNTILILLLSIYIETNHLHTPKNKDCSIISEVQYFHLCEKFLVLISLFSCKYVNYIKDILYTVLQHEALPSNRLSNFKGL